MAVTQNAVASGSGIVAGGGSTLLVRQRFDGTGETTVMRPSVLWGVGTGVVAWAVPMFMDLRRGFLKEFLEDYGEAALITGGFSAFNPKGGGVQIPTL